MPVEDSLIVLSNLVRSGIWSRTNQNVNSLRRLVIDADSVACSLYNVCVSNHWRRSQEFNLKDHYANTLVNYVEFSQLVKKFIRNLVNMNVELVLVYDGKPLEASMYGLLPAQFASQTQQVVDLIDFSRRDNKKRPVILAKDRRMTPNLAVNIFKFLINQERSKGVKITVHQAYYDSFPILTKLARDLNSIVLTDEPTFILMDSRCGFMLFDDIWSIMNLLPSDNLSSRSRSHRNSTESKSSLKNSKSGGAGLLGNQQLKLRLHFNSLFLKQHPGINQQLAVHLFPFGSPDFIIKYEMSLKRLKVDSLERKRDNFYRQLDGNSDYKNDMRYQKAAQRLETMSNFLIRRTPNELGIVVRAEAKRLKSNFEKDIKQIINNYVLACKFTTRLDYILKNTRDRRQLSFIESSLIDRECTSDYVMEMLICSLSRMATVSYNKRMQFEDLNTKKSANSLLNRGKSMLMCLLSGRQTNGKSMKSQTLSSSKSSSIRFSKDCLVVVDREKGEPIQLVVSTSQIAKSSDLDSLRDKITLDTLARNQVAQKDCAMFINLAFGSKDIRLPQGLWVERFFTKGQDDSLKEELAICLSLFRYSYNSSIVGDKYFERTYAKLKTPFEDSIMSMFVVKTSSKDSRVTSLRDSISKSKLEVVSRAAGSRPKSVSPKNEKSPSQAPGGRSKRSSSPARKSQFFPEHLEVGSELNIQVRHLIELLNSALEAYCELNAFFRYPMPKLNLQSIYNPILLFNLTVYCSKFLRDGNDVKS